MTTFPPVYILLLNYRGAGDTLKCLDSLRALDYPEFRVVVIDNHSPDDSVARFKARLAEYPGEFILIESAHNLGFSGGNNLGIEHALHHAGPQAHGYVWLLNNDTTVDPQALKNLVLQAEKTGGLAGSLLLYPEGSYQQVGTRVKWWTGGSRGYRQSDVRDGMTVECLSGASMLIPIRAIRQVGLMDPSYFLYFEDGEYSLRCARAGYALTVATESIVYHQEGATTGRKSLPTQYYFHRNRLKMLFAFASPPQKITIACYAVFRLLRSVVKSWVNPTPERKASAKVHWLAIRDFMKGVSGPCPHNLSNP